MILRSPARSLLRGVVWIAPWINLWNQHSSLLPESERFGYFLAASKFDHFGNFVVTKRVLETKTSIAK